jgi:hypothetical protein
LVAAPPAAFVLSLIGLVRKQDRQAAIWGLVLSGLLLSLFFIPLLFRCWF